MGVNFGGPAVEVAIGLAFVFFLLSLIVSGITEAFAWARNLRGKELVAGVRGMLGNSDVATKLLGHPLVRNDLGSPEPGKDPSYISSRNFALALADVVSGVNKKTNMRKIEAGIKDIGTASPLGRQLEALLARSENDLKSFLAETEKWFDDSMDRVSGWYKRNSQKITIVAAIVVTLVLNASAVRIVERLVDEPAVRAAVVARAEGAVTDGKGASGKESAPSGGGGEGKGTPSAAGDEKEATPLEAGEQVQTALASLNSLKLPILWSQANNPLHDVSVAKVLFALAGWLITVFAISLGAPFWFDALGKLAQLRTTGKKPATEEK